MTHDPSSLPSLFLFYFSPYLLIYCFLFLSVIPYLYYLGWILWIITWTFIPQIEWMVGEQRPGITQCVAEILSLWVLYFMLTIYLFEYFFLPMCSGDDYIFTLRLQINVIFTYICSTLRNNKGDTAYIKKPACEIEVCMVFKSVIM